MQGRIASVINGFNYNSRRSGSLHLERFGSTRREVDYASASVGAAIIDFDDNRAAVVEVCLFRERGQRERAMRRCCRHPVEDLAACGLFAHQVVPGSVAELTIPGHSHSIATETQSISEYICCNPQIHGAPLSLLEAEPMCTLL